MQKIQPPFSRYLWLTAGLFSVLAIAFAIYAWSEKQIDRANELRHESFLLADELRQSSDELTKMARTYVVTGDARYKAYYQEILDIRDGKAARPVGYQNVYWDLVLASGQSPRPGGGHAVALLELMRQAGFSADELSKLAEAKANSDALTATEYAAMRLVENAGPEPDAGRAMARMMMHDDRYHQAKAAIMKPINEFYELMEKRTLDAVQTTENQALILRVVFGVLALGLMFMLLRINRALRSTMGGSVDDVYEHINRIGHGDFLSPIPCADGSENSVLGWLAKTQVNLRHIDGERRQAEASLVAREALLKQILDTSSVAIFLVDMQGRITQANQRMAEMFGCPLDTLIGSEYVALVHPAERESGRQKMLALLASKLPAVELDRLYWRADHSEFWGHLTGRRFHDVSGGERGLIGVIADVDVRKQAEEKLHLAASVFTHAREGIMICSADGTIIDVNEAFTRINGYSRDEVLGQNPRILSSGRQDREYYAGMWRGLAEKGHWYGEIWNRRKSGEIYAAMQTISAIYDAQGNISQYVALFSDITALKEHERQLEHIAHYDVLTTLPNRVLLADRLHQAMAQAVRRGQPLAVAYLDLDGFKAVNDQHGHETGDRLLMTVANRMKQAMREGDTLARLGGDEFVAVLLDLADPDASEQMLNRLLAAAAQPVCLEELVLQVSASVGVTFYPQTDEVDADQLLRQADQAMYQAKLAGKNRYHLFDTKQDSSVRGHHESLERIRRALTAREFVLYYQPKVNMRTGAVIGAEALIRWQHPEQGRLAPVSFLPVIEDHPLAVDIGEWVIDTALTQIGLWRAAGLDIPVSVNVGARQLQQVDFVERLRKALAAHPDVRPGDLELEVLETSALEDVALVSLIIDACREIGVMFALDDFGTGYSSLTYLKRLAVGQLKIDQSFVRDMLDDPDDLAILEGVLGLAVAFRRQVLAEGVETVAHGEMLLQLGCELAQGYGIARPMPAADLPGWAAAWRPDPLWLGLPAVGRDDLPLLFASVEHRAWVAALGKYLRGERREAPPLDIHRCRFGEWMDAEGGPRHAVQPVFRQIDTVHRQVHALAVTLCDLDAAGRNPEALAKLVELHTLRDTLLGYLKTLVQSSRR